MSARAVVGDGVGIDVSGDEDVEADAHGPASGDGGALLAAMFGQPAVVRLGAVDGNAGPANDRGARAGEFAGEATTAGSSIEPSSADTVAPIGVGADGGVGGEETGALTIWLSLGVEGLLNSA